MTARAPDAQAPAAPRPPAGAVELDRRVSRAVDDLHESYWEAQVAAAENKTVLLVEGDDDRDVLETFLARRSATFQTRVRVVPAGGRKHVLRRMKTSFPDALALVDRDTWTDGEVAARQWPVDEVDLARRRGAHVREFQGGYAVANGGKPAG